MKVTVAEFFAREIVRNELSFDFDPVIGRQGYELPPEFFDEVAAAMVEDPLLGWPDKAIALATIVAQGWLPAEARKGSTVVPGFVWCGHGKGSGEQVIIVTARAGKRIRLRRLTGREAGKEIMVSRVALAAAFRPLAMQCARTLVGSGGDTYDPVCELPCGHEGRCRSSSAVDQHRLGSFPGEAP